MFATFAGMVITVVLFLVLYLLYAIARSGPVSPEERAREDEEQLAYLESWAKQRDSKRPH